MDYICLKPHARDKVCYQIGIIDKGEFKPTYEADKYVCAKRFVEYLNCKKLTPAAKTNAKICAGMLNIGWVRLIGGKR